MQKTDQTFASIKEFLFVQAFVSSHGCEGEKPIDCFPVYHTMESKVYLRLLLGFVMLCAQRLTENHTLFTFPFFFLGCGRGAFNRFPFH
jgi:hypothetical protein